MKKKEEGDKRTIRINILMSPKERKQFEDVRFEGRYSSMGAMIRDAVARRACQLEL